MIAPLWDLAHELLPAEVFRTQVITGVCDIEWRARPDPRERRFEQNLLLVTTDDQGTAFYDDLPVEPASRLLGSGVGEAAGFSLPVQIAVLDSLFAAHRRSMTAAQSVTLEGTMPAKSPLRTRFICDEVLHQLRTRPGKGTRPRVSLVGVSSFQAALLASEGVEIAAWDNNPTFAGTELFPGVVVRQTLDPDEQLAGADVALVTGMTLSTGTLPGLARAAARRDAALVVWAVTGGNLAPYFLHHGVDAVISETFPFYFFPGRTRLDCYRKGLSSFLGK